MVIQRRVSWFDDDIHAGRNKLFSSESKSFVWNWDDLPVDVLFAVLMTVAPFDVTLSVTTAGPVLDLAIFGAVSPLVASATQFGRISTDLETVGAVPDSTFLLHENCISHYLIKHILIVLHTLDLLFESISPRLKPMKSG